MGLRLLKNNIFNLILVLEKESGDIQGNFSSSRLGHEYLYQISQQSNPENVNHGRRHCRKDQDIKSARCPNSIQLMMRYFTGLSDSGPAGGVRLNVMGSLKSLGLNITGTMDICSKGHINPPSIVWIFSLKDARNAAMDWQPVLGT